MLICQVFTFSLKTEKLMFSLYESILFFIKYIFGDKPYDWIDNRKNGFVVSSFNQVEELVNELLDNPVLLHEVSKNTQELAHRFDWKKIINDWEKVIEDLYNGK